MKITSYIIDNEKSLAYITQREYTTQRDKNHRLFTPSKNLKWIDFQGDPIK